MKKLTCITVDLEEEFIPDASELHHIVDQILLIFKRYQIRGTFFISGNMVENYKELIFKIAEKHEIAAHGFRHQNLRRLKRKELEQEIKKTGNAFIKLGLECKGFRCPYLITPSHLGDILSTNHFLYDSSQMDSPFTLKTLFYPFSKREVKGIHEIPLQTITPLRFPLNLSFFRLLGSKHVSLFFPDDIKMFYFHPWELCEKKIMTGSHFIKQLHFNTGKKALKILENLFGYLKVRKYQFVTCKDWLKYHQ